MPLLHCQYVAIHTYWCWNCGQNLFAELTLPSPSHDASLDRECVLYIGRWFYGAPEFRCRATMLQCQSYEWTIPSCTVSAHLKWYRKTLSSADSQYSLYQQYSRWWLQSQHWIDRCEIAHPSCWSCLPPHTPHVLQRSIFEQVVWWICFWDQLT